LLDEALQRCFFFSFLVADSLPSFFVDGKGGHHVGDPAKVVAMDPPHGFLSCDAAHLANEPDLIVADCVLRDRYSFLFELLSRLALHFLKFSICISTN